MSSAWFRANAGICVTDGRGHVLAMRRRGARDTPWQMPQGGIKDHETPEQAAWRELEEETGLTGAHARLIGALIDWVVYELPPALRSPRLGWGQAQRWFLFQVAPDAPVRPDGRELDAWTWMRPDELLAETVEFRRPVYRRVFDQFFREAGTAAPG